MAGSINTVTLVGHVGADPEIRTTAGGTKVAKVSLATNRTFKDRSGVKQERTDWHRVTFFGPVVENVVQRFVEKGARIGVTGRIEYSTTEDESGATRYWTDIIADDLALLSDGPGKPAPSPFDT